MSDIHKDKNNPNFGKKFSKTICEKTAKKRKGFKHSESTWLKKDDYEKSI